jgi:hypothetical protein
MRGTRFSLGRLRVSIGPVGASASTPAPPVVEQKASPEAAQASADAEGQAFWKDLSGLLRMLGSIAGQTTLLAALLFYFGWARTQAAFSYFGWTLPWLSFLPAITSSEAWMSQSGHWSPSGSWPSSSSGGTST